MSEEDPLVSYRSGDVEEEEENNSRGRNTNSERKWIFFCPALCLVGLTAFVAAVLVSYLQQQAGVTATLRVMSLNTWGMPETLGSSDKEVRIAAIADIISRKEFDLYLLEELWMRPDHEAIKARVPQDFYITDYEDFTIANCPGIVLTPFLCCDGIIAPGGCSGLTVVSRYPFTEKPEFNVYMDHGPLAGGESLARKGFGRVRIRPGDKNMTVDVYLTHTCATDENGPHREKQVEQLLTHISGSTADFVILGGDFNVDPRAKETTYHSLKSELVSCMEEFFKVIADWLIPQKATYGNPRNIYSNSYSPVLYDYIWHKANKRNTILTNIFDVPFLHTVKTTQHLLEETGLFEARNQQISLSDHEAVTASLLLLKSIYSED